MKEETIFWVLLGILAFDYLLERVLSYLNLRSSRKAIPDELAGIYDEEKYAKSQAYQRERGVFSLFSTTFSFLLTIAAISLGLFGWLDGWIRSFGPNDLVNSLMFFGVIFLVSDILGIPFDLYSVFKIEEKYGFNRMTLKTYVFDKIKGYVLAILIGGILAALFIYMVNAIGVGFWLYFWGVVTIFLLFVNVFYTTLILPLFNKLEPMEESSLKKAIKAFSEQVNFPLKNIFVMDGSKRSSKGNAFFSGLGRYKKVVLYDTLVEKHTVEELTSVFAHEVGHFKKKHIISSTILGIAQVGLMLFLLSQMVLSTEVSWAMGGDKTALHLNVLAFGILYSPISRLLGMLMNVWSRKNEYEADAYAVQHYGGEPLTAALKKMSADHFSNLTPHPAYVFVHYSHPSLLQRVQAMQRGMRKQV
ncbi:MAG: M48 family metallopeptidase [Cyclobacteriaceae bacterium]|nr:M48 family metallopeptidase [Cyclobacteriaceae bacterium HetDA_MAG_MS6]